jgi:exopolysaccharide production repressor protein
MNFPQFLVGMTTVSSVVAISTFLTTGSIWKALAGTILTLIVLQAAYFVLVVGLIYGAGAEDAEANPRSAGAGRPEHRDGVRPRS